MSCSYASLFSNLQKIFKMKNLLWLACFIPEMLFAQMPITQKPNTLVPLNDVQVWVTRALQSKDGLYLLHLNSGYWNPNATLYDLSQDRGLSFEGFQKGTHIRLSSFDPEIGDSAKGAYLLSGQLDVDLATFKATLTDKNATFSRGLVFEPLVTVENRPTFTFKFSGLENKERHNYSIESIDVLDKKTNKLHQRLSGFSAYDYSVDYVDINYDGYFDLVLTDISNGRSVGERYYIIWMYNPKTARFQRAPELEKLRGHPSLYINERQVNFGNGHLYHVENGKFYLVK